MTALNERRPGDETGASEEAGQPASSLGPGSDNAESAACVLCDTPAGDPPLCPPCRTALGEQLRRRRDAELRMQPLADLIGRAA